MNSPSQQSAGPYIGQYCLEITVAYDVSEVCGP